MQLLLHNAEWNMGNIFPVSYIFQLISQAFRRVTKKIFTNAASENYFIVKCLLKSNVARVILLTKCIELA